MADTPTGTGAPAPAPAPDAPTPPTPATPEAASEPGWLPKVIGAIKDGFAAREPPKPEPAPAAPEPPPEPPPKTDDPAVLALRKQVADLEADRDKARKAEAEAKAQADQLAARTAFESAVKAALANAPVAPGADVDILRRATEAGYKLTDGKLADDAGKSFDDFLTGLRKTDAPFLFGSPQGAPGSPTATTGHRAPTAVLRSPSPEEWHANLDKIAKGEVQVDWEGNQPPALIQ